MSLNDSKIFTKVEDLKKAIQEIDGDKVIDENVDLNSINYNEKLEIKDVTFNGEFNLSEAHFFKTLDLSDCTFTKNINLEKIRVDGDLILERIKITAGTDRKNHAKLSSIHIAKDLNMKEAICNGTIDLNRAKISGKAVFDGSKIEGSLLLQAVNIDGNLFCKPIKGRPTKIGKQLRLRAAKILNQVDISGAIMGKNLKEEDLEMDDDQYHKIALVLEAAEIHNGFFCSPTKIEENVGDSDSKISEYHQTVFEGDVWINDAKISYKLDLSGAIINGSLNMKGATINGKLDMKTEFLGNRDDPTNVTPFCTDIKGKADLSRVTISGECELNGLKVGEEINLKQAEIKGGLDCSSALDVKTIVGSKSSTDKSRNIFELSGAIISGEAKFDKIEIFGNLVLKGSDITGGATFDEIKIFGDLILKGSDIKGSLEINKAEIHGEVNLFGYKILGQLSLDNSTIDKKLSLEGVKVDRDILCNINKVNEIDLKFCNSNRLEFSTKKLSYLKVIDLSNSNFIELKLDLNLNRLNLSEPLRLLGCRYEKLDFGEQDTKFDVKFTKNSHISGIIKTLIKTFVPFIPSSIRFAKLLQTEEQTTLQITKPTDQAKFKNLDSIDFSGTAPTGIVRVELKAYEQRLGSNDVDFTGCWSIAYSGFSGTGDYEITAIGFDEANQPKGEMSIRIRIYTYIAEPFLFKVFLFKVSKFLLKELSDSFKVSESDLFKVSEFLFYERSKYIRFLDKTIKITEKITKPKKKSFSFFKAYEIKGFHKENYLYLAQWLRNQGFNIEGERVYREMRDVDKYARLSIINDFQYTLIKIWNVIQSFFTGYGTEPYRILLYILPVLVISSWIFLQPDALHVAKEPIHKGADCNAFPKVIWEALQVIFPILPIIAADDCVPSDNNFFYFVTYSSFANVVSLLSLIFVPLFLAWVSGIGKGIEEINRLVESDKKDKS